MRAMPFPKKNLNAGETIALDMHPHWWYFSEAAVALVASIVFGIVVLAKDPQGSGGTALRWLSLILIVGTALWLLVRYLRWMTTNLVITSDRLIFRQGIFAKSGIEIPLNRVNNVNFSQSVWERLLGAGDLLIESGGEDGQQRFTDIRHPERVQNLIHAATEALEQRRAAYSAQAAAASAAPPTTGDVAGQLERLEGLLQRGSLTQEEFDAQKRKLLEG